MDFDGFRFCTMYERSGYCSLEKELLMCSNSLFRKFGEQILWALRKTL